MFFVLPFRDSVIVTPAAPMFGHGLPVPASACPDPSSQNSSVFLAANVVFGTSAVVLALIAFGGGAVLLLLRSPYAKGIGLGLMIGWALTSVFTVGFCTGINPGLYTL